MQENIKKEKRGKKLAGTIPKMTPAQVKVYNRINRQIDINNYRYEYNQGGEKEREPIRVVPSHEKVEKAKPMLRQSRNCVSI